MIQTATRISTVGSLQAFRQRAVLAAPALATRYGDVYLPARPAAVAVPVLPAYAPIPPRVVAQPAPAPAPAPSRPAPAPVQPASLPKPAPKPAGALAGFGLKVGSTYAIAPGTTVKGHAVTGTARVVAVGPDHVELRMKGAAAGGLVNFDVRFKAAKQADGSVKLTADMADPTGVNDRGTVLLDQKAKVLKQDAGDLRLRTADGKNARLALANRGLNIQVDDMNLQLVRTA